MSNVWCLALWLIVSTSRPAIANPSPDLAAALKRYQNLASLRVSFEQIKKLKDMDFEIRSKGELKMEPEYLVWQVHSPVPLKVEVRENQLRIGEKDQKIPEAYRRELSQMLGWLKFDPVAWSTDYEVEKGQDGLWLFKSRQPQSAFKTARLKLSPKGFAEEVELTEISDDRILVKFQEPKVHYRK